MTEIEENPFRSYRHTASVAGMPVFMITLILMLAGIQPVGSVLLWGVVSIAVLLGVGLSVGLLAVRKQEAKGNPHCATPAGRRYLLFVFVCSLVGIASVAELAILVFSGWIRLNISVLLLGMLASLTLALAGSGILWHILGRPHGK